AGDRVSPGSKTPLASGQAQRYFGPGPRTGRPGHDGQEPDLLAVAAATTGALLLVTAVFLWRGGGRRHDRGTFGGY
ncbi:hypothetical protein ACFU99_42310, partial [Streptomyces sp. NPDC057654]